jgi:hypothetical protein
LLLFRGGVRAKIVREEEEKQEEKKIESISRARSQKEATKDNPRARYHWWSKSHLSETISKRIKPAVKS